MWGLQNTKYFQVVYLTEGLNMNGMYVTRILLFQDEHTIAEAGRKFSTKPAMNPILRKR
jgi:hypothetical protein